MNVKKNEVSFDARHNDWEEIANWPSEHPPTSDINTDVENRLLDGELLHQLRLKHISWYEGEYSPSDEEYYLFVIDKDFVGSPEYLTYRKEEIDSVAKKRADIYAPSDEEVKRNIAPFVELVRSDINSLVEIGSKMEISNISQENVSEIADYFCAKFDVGERPKTELIWGSNLSGAYNHNNHKIKVEFSKTCSVAELVSTIAHEVWHAHQYRSDSELYKYNWENYYQSSMDYDAYRAQLIEKEAYFIDDSIGKLYRRADLESHPEKIPNLLKLFNKWLANKYKSYESEDGWDVEYLCIADEMRYHGIAITAIRALKKYFRIGEKK